METLNQRCLTLEKQHKTREIQEKENLQKVQEFTNRFHGMSRMIQKIDYDYVAL